MRSSRFQGGVLGATVAFTVTSCDYLVDFDKDYIRQPCTVDSDCDNPDPPNPCIRGQCVKGGCSPAVTVHAPCSASGPGVCNGSGECVGCLEGPDCPSGVCKAEICVCDDGVKNEAETDIDCGGSSCPACGAASQCSMDADCLGDGCSGGVCVACGDADWVQWIPGDAGDWAVRATTVRDKQTGLTWQREASPERMTWAASSSYCEALVLDGGVWRLPTRIELTSIVDYTRSVPALETDTFLGENNDAFWSATSKAGDDGTAWYVSFMNGLVDVDVKANSLRVRCVR